MNSEKNSRWYRAAMYVIPILAAFAAIGKAYDWSNVIREDTQEFLYRFEPAVPEGYVVVSDPVDVSVTLKGSATRREALANETMRVIRPEDAINKTGKHQIQIPHPTDVRGMKVIEIDPASVSVEIDSLVARELKVNAEIVGEAAPNYRVGSVTVSPEVLTVRAPSRSELTTALNTLPVSVNGYDKTTTIDDIAVELPEHYSFPSSGRTTVSVTVEVLPIREQRLLDPIKIEVENPPAGYTVTVHPAFVAVQVDVPVDREPIGAVRARVDASRIARTSADDIAEGFHSGHALELIGVPSDIEDALTRPDKITLEVRKNASIGDAP